LGYRSRASARVTVASVPHDSHLKTKDEGVSEAGHGPCEAVSD
jgi:hypothetical protein